MAKNPFGNKQALPFGKDKSDNDTDDKKMKPNKKSKKVSRGK